MKNRLDTHYSFINLKLKAYVRYAHDIPTENDIVDALLFKMF